MRDKIVAVLLSCVLAWLLFMQFFGTPWPWKLWTVKHELTIYLEEKYGEPFIVGIPQFALIGGDFHAEASPKARPELVFIVGKEQGEHGIQDSYLRALSEQPSE
ncbi:MAG: hypothetical protein ABS949_08100 [Solibacillus sp.]